MGRDKRFLTVDGETMVERAYGALRDAFGPPWVLVADEHDAELLAPLLGPGTRFLADRAPGSGPLAALADALGELDRRHAFLLATDLPLVTSAFLTAFDRMRSTLAPEPDVLLPKAEGLAQVTCGFYRATLAGSMRAALHGGGSSLAEWVGRPDIRARFLRDDELLDLGGPGALVNVNTPEEHARVRGR